MRSYWGVACIIAIMQVTPMSAGEALLSTYQWTKRVLLVFGQDVDTARFRRQREMLLLAEHGLNERDMVVICIVGSVASTEGRPAAPAAARDLRDAYGVPHEFRVVLIGKDGGVELSQEEPISVADLFALIDPMPTREQEMRERSE